MSYRDVKTRLDAKYPNLYMTRAEVNRETLGIEVKAPKGKQSESQKAIQAEIEKAGGKYIVARSLDDVKVIFEKGKK